MQKVLFDLIILNYFNKRNTLFIFYWKNSNFIFFTHINSSNTVLNIFLHNWTVATETISVTFANIANIYHTHGNGDTAFQSIDTDIMPCALANTATFHAYGNRSTTIFVVSEYFFDRCFIINEIRRFPLWCNCTTKNRKHAPTDGVWAVL